MLLAFSLSVWASPNYPGELQVLSGGACLPTCTVCHATAGGGSGTVTKDFGIAMEDRGMVGGGDVAALTTAWDTMGTDVVDSDGDGTMDVDEITAGEDPNPEGVPFCDVVTPVYGCFNSSALPASTIGVLAGLAALLRRR